MLGFQSRMFYFYRIWTDAPPSYLDGQVDDFNRQILSKCIELYSNWPNSDYSKFEDHCFQFLFNINTNWFEMNTERCSKYTLAEAKCLLYNTAIGIGNILLEENNAALIRLPDENKEPNEKLYVFGFVTIDEKENRCSPSTGEVWKYFSHTRLEDNTIYKKIDGVNQSVGYNPKILESDEEVDFVQEIFDYVIDFLADTASNRGPRMPEIMDECMEALRIELTPGTPEEKAAMEKAAQVKSAKRFVSKLKTFRQSFEDVIKDMPPVPVDQCENEYWVSRDRIQKSTDTLKNQRYKNNIDKIEHEEGTLGRDSQGRIYWNPNTTNIFFYWIKHLRHDDLKKKK